MKIGRCAPESDVRGLHRAVGRPGTSGRHWPLHFTGGLGLNGGKLRGHILELFKLERFGLGPRLHLKSTLQLFLLVSYELEIVLPVVFGCKTGQLEVPAEPIDGVQDIGDGRAVMSAFEDHHKWRLKVIIQI
jgi:hypothetical protein